MNNQQLPPFPENELWITQQAADYLRVHSKTVFNLRKKGMPYLQVGGAVRFVPQDIRNYFLNNPRLALHRRRQIIRKGEKKV